MNPGAYPACLHDRPLADALAVLRDLGLDGAEVDCGGFLPAPRLPAAEIRAGGAEDQLGVFAEAGRDTAAASTLPEAAGRSYTKALCPVIDRPTTRVLIWRVPSKEYSASASAKNFATP